MITSLRGFQLIQKFEGRKLKAYKCPAGVWTIGYGHTKNVREGMKITKDEALILLTRDVLFFEKHLHRILPSQLCNQNQYDAIASLVFNIGIIAFQRSTLLKQLKRLEYIAAADEFLKWKYIGKTISKGLLRRRIAEKRLFLTKGK